MGVPGTPPEIPPCPPDNECNRFSLLPGALRSFSALGNRFSLLPGALRPFSAPGKRFSLLPGAQEAFFALGNRFSLLPGELVPFSALGNRFSLLPGALVPFSALGNRFSLLPGALRPFSALGNRFSLLSGALVPFSAPSNHVSFSRNRRDGKSGRKAWRESRVDQVHFEGLYQVHPPCLRSPFGAYLADLVHPVKSDQVHREGLQFLLGGRSNVSGQARPPGASKAPGKPR